MGLFMQRPEEPGEWAGIPSDPDREESAAEQLANAAPVDMGFLGLPGEGSAIESIIIPVVPAIEIVESQESAEGDAP